MHEQSNKKVRKENTINFGDESFSKKSKKKKKNVFNAKNY
jgi:hypothetical protein